MYLSCPFHEAASATLAHIVVSQSFPPTTPLHPGAHTLSHPQRQPANRRVPRIQELSSLSTYSLPCVGASSKPLNRCPIQTPHPPSDPRPDFEATEGQPPILEGIVDCAHDTPRQERNRKARRIGSRPCLETDLSITVATPFYLGVSSFDRRILDSPGLPTVLLRPQASYIFEVQRRTNLQPRRGVVVSDGQCFYHPKPPLTNTCIPIALAPWGEKAEDEPSWPILFYTGLGTRDSYTTLDTIRYDTIHTPLWN